MALSDEELTRYLERLAVPPRVPDAELLCELHVAHLTRVPFENLDILAGTPIALDQDALLHKLLDRRRGGFCYELNGAFALLLEALGYRVDRLEARVYDDGELGIRFDHLCLRVEVPRDGGTYLADVGFGASFTEPLPFVVDTDHDDPAGTYRIARTDDPDVFDLVEAGTPRYRFTTTPRTLADFEPGRAHHTSSPDSGFTRRSVCTRLTDDGRITVRDLRVITTSGGQRDERELTRDEVRDLYEREFGMTVDLPVPAPELREVARIWWDVDHIPVVVWDVTATRFDLVDLQASTRRLTLARFDEPVDDPEAMATVLAEGLAACDFPPTGDGAAQGRVRATLEAAGRSERPAR